MFHSIILSNFSVRMQKYIYKNFIKNFDHKKLKKNHPKKLHTYGSWKVFFSPAPTAQKSADFHFRFVNSFIQPSLEGSLLTIELDQGCVEGQSLGSLCNH